jgi:hypothetical protein
VRESMEFDDEDEEYEEDDEYEEDISDIEPLEPKMVGKGTIVYFILISASIVSGIILLNLFDVI